MTTKRAVILFNLGGPDGPDAVKPFLFNLFNDPAIIDLPNPFRWIIAKMISRRRAPIAREIYSQIGGKSPLMKETAAQARALEQILNGPGKPETRVFVCMRYWHPLSAGAARAVADFNPDEVIELPLYPQYSTTTSGSSLKDWRRAAKKAGITAEGKAVCCYPTAPGLITAQADLVAEGILAAKERGTPRVLFSAHGLPKKVIAKGDPYQWQVEQTSEAVITELRKRDVPDFDPVVCYQSQVGPLQWIGPSTEDEIKRAGADKVPLVVVPIAFVSEHSETLVELDIEYAEVAAHAGVPAYHRVPTVTVQPAFIEALAEIVETTAASTVQTCHSSGMRICPGDRSRCPCRA
ncbi:MAG: ferrochelatase [Rhodospirillales bacterium]